MPDFGKCNNYCIVSPLQDFRGHMIRTVYLYEHNFSLLNIYHWIHVDCMSTSQKEEAKCHLYIIVKDFTR